MRPLMSCERFPETLDIGSWSHPPARRSKCLPLQTRISSCEFVTGDIRGMEVAGPVTPVKNRRLCALFWLHLWTGRRNV